jgi:hypothetical protein
LVSSSLKTIFSWISLHKNFKSMMLVTIRPVRAFDEKDEKF